MGFEKKKRIYRLIFVGTDLEGLEIRIHGLTVGEVTEMEAMENNEEAGRRAMALFASKIVEWNLTDDGVPVPPSLEAVMGLEPRDVAAAMEQWKEQTTGVSGPLGQRSSDGPPSAEALTLTAMSSPLLPH